MWPSGLDGCLCGKAIGAVPCRVSWVQIPKSPIGKFEHQRHKYKKRKKPLSSLFTFSSLISSIRDEMKAELYLHLTSITNIPLIPFPFHHSSSRHPAQSRRTCFMQFISSKIPAARNSCARDRMHQYFSHAPHGYLTPIFPTCDKWFHYTLSIHPFHCLFLLCSFCFLSNSLSSQCFSRGTRLPPFPYNYPRFSVPVFPLSILFH
jgi:hypothetical protein